VKEVIKKKVKRGFMFRSLVVVGHEVYAVKEATHPFITLVPLMW
jgi:hypothetical protein